MVNLVKKIVFKGSGTEDLDQFWFVANAVWEYQGIVDDQMKKETLLTSLQERVLTCYIKYYTDNPMATLVDIQTALNNEFSRTKSKSQSIVGFKEIMMNPGETPWGLDWRLKCTIRETNMNLTDVRHYEYFVASLLPHLRVSL